MLSESQLAARRAAARRRRARRRAALATASAVIVGAVTWLAVAGGSAGHRPGARPGASSASSSAGPARSAPSSPGLDRAVDHLLSYTSYVELAGRQRREVALTFDDGPGPSTRAILRILRRTHTPATFFLIGRYARARPRLVAAEVRDGFAIGDHTETHPMLSHLSRTAQEQEIGGGASSIERAGARHIRLFRPPYGSFDQTTLSLLHDRRMLMVLWSADTKDYGQPGARKIIYAGISGGQPGAIVLMHDGGGDHRQTVIALPRIIARLRRRGFRLVTIPELIAEAPPGHQPPPRQLSGRL